MNNEIMMYGIAQKEQQGFDKAVEECKYRMSRYGVTPNMLILPPQMLLYMVRAAARSTRARNRSHPCAHDPGACA